MIWNHGQNNNNNNNNNSLPRRPEAMQRPLPL
jgi:hypothetical protein